MQNNGDHVIAIRRTLASCSIKPRRLTIERDQNVILAVTAFIGIDIIAAYSLSGTDRKRGISLVGQFDEKRATSFGEHIGPSKIGEGNLHQNHNIGYPRLFDNFLTLEQNAVDLQAGGFAVYMDFKLGVDALGRNDFGSDGDMGAKVRIGGGGGRWVV